MASLASYVRQLHKAPKGMHVMSIPSYFLDGSYVIIPYLLNHLDTIQADHMAKTT